VPFLSSLAELQQWADLFSKHTLAKAANLLVKNAIDTPQTAHRLNLNPAGFDVRSSGTDE
jgi:hypothetical protein